MASNYKIHPDQVHCPKCSQQMSRKQSWGYIDSYSEIDRCGIEWLDWKCICGFSASSMAEYNLNTARERNFHWS